MTKNTPSKECAPEETIKEDSPLAGLLEENEAVGGASGTESTSSSEGNGTIIISDDSDNADLSDVEFPQAPTPPPTLASTSSSSRAGSFSYVLTTDSSEEDLPPERPLLRPKANDALNKTGTSSTSMTTQSSASSSSRTTSSSDEDSDSPSNNNVNFGRCRLYKRMSEQIMFCRACFQWTTAFCVRGAKKMKLDSEAAENSKKPEKQRPRKRSASSSPLHDEGAVGTAEPQLSNEPDAVPSTSNSRPAGHSAMTNACDNERADDICGVCFGRRNDGMFIHPNLAHQYGCYSCAIRMWYYWGYCPLCRQRVPNFLRLS